MVYVATAEPLDEEMAERIRIHRKRRPATWRTIEERLEVSSAAHNALPADAVILEDLTLLLSNAMAPVRDEATMDARGWARAEATVTREVDALLDLPAHVVIVSNEVGMGIVPERPLARAFRDALGRIHQRAAAACSEVYLLVAGIPLRVK